MSVGVPPVQAVSQVVMAHVSSRPELITHTSSGDMKRVRLGGPEQASQSSNFSGQCIHLLCTALLCDDGHQLAFELMQEIFTMTNHSDSAGLLPSDFFLVSTMFCTSLPFDQSAFKFDLHQNESPTPNA